MVYRKRAKGLPPGKASPGYKRPRRKPNPRLLKRVVKTRKERIEYVRDWQHGTSSLPRDLARLAKPPGKRISRSGRVYYEYRRNRSDAKGRV